MNVTPENLPAIVWQNQSVITTELLAAVYGTEVKNIQMNFERNKSRFTDGKHYFLLKGADLKAFKHRPTLNGSVESIEIVGKNANALILWSELGAMRHAKMLETNQAWDVYEMLENFYFSTRNKSIDADWDMRRSLARTNYKIHTDAIKQYGLEEGNNESLVYCCEADIINRAVFGMVAARWKKDNPDKKGTIRDHATVLQLVVLANLEAQNALLLQQGYNTIERHAMLFELAQMQFKTLENNASIKKLMN